VKNHLHNILRQAGRLDRLELALYGHSQGLPHRTRGLTGGRGRAILPLSRPSGRRVPPLSDLQHPASRALPVPPIAVGPPRSAVAKLKHFNSISCQINLDTSVRRSFSARKNRRLPPVCAAGIKAVPQRNLRHAGKSTRQRSLANHRCGSAPVGAAEVHRISPERGPLSKRICAAFSFVSHSSSVSLTVEAVCDAHRREIVQQTRIQKGRLCNEAVFSLWMNGNQGARLGCRLAPRLFSRWRAFPPAPAFGQAILGTGSSDDKLVNRPGTGSGVGADLQHRRVH